MIKIDLSIGVIALVVGDDVAARCYVWEAEGLVITGMSEDEDEDNDDDGNDVEEQKMTIIKMSPLFELASRL